MMLSGVKLVWHDC